MRPRVVVPRRLEGIDHVARIVAEQPSREVLQHLLQEVLPLLELLLTGRVGARAGEDSGVCASVYGCVCTGVGVGVFLLKKKSRYTGISSESELAQQRMATFVGRVRILCWASSDSWVIWLSRRGSRMPVGIFSQT